MKKISYRGWKDCYLLSNEHIRVVINASAGGRIMAFERNGTNVIYQNPEQDGLLLKDYLEKGFDPDGGRFDYGPEEFTRDRHALSYMGPWTVKFINDNSLLITSLPDPELGILSLRMFSLEAGMSKLSITQTMINITDKICEYFFWGRTLVILGGKLFLPLNKDSSIPGQWGRYIWGKPERFIIDNEDQGVIIEDNIFSLRPDLAGNEKYGNDSHAGWMAYGVNSLLFVKKYNYFPLGNYTEKYFQTSIFYTNRHSFAEMEPVSPAAYIKKGEEYTYTEDWYLFDYPPASEPGFDLNQATAFVKTGIGL